MLNIKLISEKEALNISNKESLFLVEIEGVKNKIKSNKKSQRLNLSLVIDISGSMNGQVAPVDLSNYVANRNNYLMGGVGFNIETQCKKSTSKLSLTKKAAISAIEKMNVGDFISLVVFDDSVDVLFESQEITEKNRKKIIKEISQLNTRGGTDLHKGWLTGATEVAKTMKEDFINRVIVLSDGVTYSGIVDPLEICKNVGLLNKKGVSTTTIGIGSDFNEDLLQNMSSSGGGNFYYVKDIKDFDDVFNQEFTGLLNVSGSEIGLGFDFDSGFEVLEQLNQIELKDGTYNVSDISGGKKVSLLFKIKTPIKKDFDIKTKIDVGTLVLTYKDNTGKKVKEEIKIEMPVLKNKKWSDLEFNKEIKVQDMLLEIANEKLKSGDLASSGNIDGAKDILRGVSALTISAGIEDDRLTDSLKTLEDSIKMADEMNSGDFKKTMMYATYRSRTSKD